ncbi:sugar nucleotide-binding protein [Cupriavidus sp. AU9028]|uniref:sugar nucleotide-binding protein n=1 Tax=Cupriavidus sp. AU9028 TaxID=2871157 RepID=UPI001C98894C|nr:sugar nucleotide-binding protein [Cupriavidus sp. AU9028]MBY4897252.1 sugar nucleotide-binding protein [Cupriavidus sp. AU9028]
MSKDLSSPRLGRPRLLIVGCGDVGTRCLRLLAGRWRVFALTSQPSRVAQLRAAGAVPLVGNLDMPVAQRTHKGATLARLHGLAARVVHLAPPPGQGDGDPRTAALLQALRGRGAGRLAALPPGSTVPRVAGARKPRILPERLGSRPASQPWAARVGRQRHAQAAEPGTRPVLVYGSTSGVYGDRRGARVAESDPARPTTARARRRVAAETAIRAFALRSGWRAGIVRIPGIYAEDRLPLARLRKGTPALAPQDDVFTNHIHADDLARILIAKLMRGLPQRIVHASDDSELRMGDYFDLVADRHGLPRPPRMTRAGIAEVVEPPLLSFMGESRRLENRRLKRELRLRLRYPTVADFLGR